MSYVYSLLADLNYAYSIEDHESEEVLLSLLTDVAADYNAEPYFTGAEYVIVYVA